MRFYVPPRKKVRISGDIAFWYAFFVLCNNVQCPSVNVSVVGEGHLQLQLFEAIKVFSVILGQVFRLALLLFESVFLSSPFTLAAMPMMPPSC